MSRGQIPSTLLARTYPRPPISTNPSAPAPFPAQEPARTYAAGTVPECGWAGRQSPRPAGSAASCAAPRRRGQRALIGDDVTDNLFGQRRVAETQQRLPVRRRSSI